MKVRGGRVGGGVDGCDRFLSCCCAQGLGGPWRQVLSDITKELQPTETEPLNALPLCVLSPNGVLRVGEGRDLVVPSSSWAESGAALGHWECLGKLLGAAVRTHALCDLRWPPGVWRRLLGRPSIPSDLTAIDVSASRELERLRSPDLTLEEFHTAYPEVSWVYMWCVCVCGTAYRRCPLSLNFHYS
jgi:hypothetical protein